MIDNLKICLSCEHLQRGCQGPCACTLDGREIKAHAAEGACPINRFSGEPRSFLHALIGIAKAVLRVDQADKQTIAARRVICRGCPESVTSLGGVLATCRICGCALALKTTLKGESCPQGKWPAVDDKGKASNGR
jgi:hypothetical protein